MSEVRQMQAYQVWFDGQHDREARFRIAYGPGYRDYDQRAGSGVVVLLLGGDKRSQTRDIVRARVLAQGP